ncbi:uncharacterized protein [Amphiura filiformis]|uniref:uncharacterized protein n=1 Tax=Amphiura filiformis TaxID=82378 RepID=UPI003B2251CA
MPRGHGRVSQALPRSELAVRSFLSGMNGETETKDVSENGDDKFPFGMHPFFYSTGTTAAEGDVDDEENIMLQRMRERMLFEIYMRNLFSCLRPEQETEGQGHQQKWRNRSDHDLPPSNSRFPHAADDESEDTQHPRHFYYNPSSPHGSRHRHSERVDEASDWQRNRGHSGRQYQDRQNNSSGKNASSRKTHYDAAPMNQRRRSRKGKRFRKAANAQCFPRSGWNVGADDYDDQHTFHYCLIFIFVILCSFGVLYLCIYLSLSK